MNESLRTEGPAAGAGQVALHPPASAGELSQEALRQVAEDVRAAFPHVPELAELVMIDVDPHHLHAFWTVPAAAVEAARKALNGEATTAPMVLRLLATDAAGTALGGPIDIEVVGLQGQFYVDLWDEPRRYQASLGLRRRDGSLVLLTRSEPAELPPAGPAADRTWREIAVPPPPAAAALPPLDLPPVARRTAQIRNTIPATKAALAPMPVTAAVPASATASLAPDPNFGQAPPLALAAQRPSAPLAAPEPGNLGVAGPAGAPLLPTPASAGGPVPAALTEPPAARRDVPRPAAAGAGSPPAARRSGENGASRPSVPPRSPGGELSVPARGVHDRPAAVNGGPAVPAAAPPLARPQDRPSPAAGSTPSEGLAAVALESGEFSEPLTYWPFPDTPPQATAAAPVATRTASTEARHESGEVGRGAEAAGEGEAESGPPPLPLPLENVLTLSSFVLGREAVDFEINAELHIFGRAKPGSRLQLFGRPVTVRPDGSFVVNRPLPNGALVLSAFLAKNGEQDD